MGGRVVIEKGAFLSAGVTLNPRVRIGTNSIIGSGSVVVGDIPPGVLAFGVPAKVIRQVSAADCDVLVLERKSYGGYTVWRKITSKINRLFLRVLFGPTGISDMNYTQIYRLDIMHKIMPLAKSPAFTTPEMILRANGLGFRVKPIPADYQPRTIRSGAFGKTHDILWSLCDMLRFRFKVWSKL